MQGNHDFEVLNSQDFKNPDPILAYNAKLWDRYLDSEEAKRSFLKAGYYTTKLRTSDGRVHDKVNIVAINT